MTVEYLIHITTYFSRGNQQLETTRLGRTNLTVTRTAFGVLPLQRVDMPESVRILRRAYDAGITFYDTARAYTDSEEKIGNALSDVRSSIIIATKSAFNHQIGNSGRSRDQPAGTCARITWIFSNCITRA